MRELDAALNFVKEKCDIIRDKDGKADVITTGLGANLNKAKLEKELGIRFVTLNHLDLFHQNSLYTSTFLIFLGRLTNISEMDLFSQAFAFLSNNAKQEDLFEPLSKNGKTL